jgi:hypothetical protein
MSSYTVIVSLKSTGRIMMDMAGDGGTPEAAVRAFCLKHKLTDELLADVVVLLGMTGSSVLHRSAGKVSKQRGRASSAELEAAFLLVKPKGYWKDPIDVTIPRPSAKVLRHIEEAVPFFTGGAADISPCGKGKVRVVAAGYYATIGS